MNGSAMARLVALGSLGSALHEGRGAGKTTTPGGREKHAYFWRESYGNGPEASLFLGDRRAIGLRLERSIRDRKGNRYLSGFGLERLFCSFQVDPQTWQL